MKKILKAYYKNHKTWLHEAFSWFFVIAVMASVLLLIVLHASASTSGQIRLYLHKDNSDANETYNSLGVSPAEPGSDTSAGTIGFIQSKSTATATVTFTSAPVQNHLLVAYVFSSSSTAITMTSVGWTAGTSCATGSGQSTRAGRLFWKIAGASESSTVTAASGNNISVAEYSGIDTTTPLDGTAAGTAENSQANASGTNTTNSITPIQGRQTLVIVGLGVRSTSATYSAQAVSGSNVGTVNKRESPGTTNASSMLGDAIIGSTIDAHQGSATPSANAVGCGSIGVFEASNATSSTNTNATPATSFCEASNNTTDNINAIAVDSGTAANRCVGTFISQPLVGSAGGTIALSTGDTASITGQFWSMESSTTATAAFNAYIYRWNGTGTTVNSTDRIATLTCADPGSTVTSCTPTAVSPANNVTFNAGDRLVVIVSLNVTATVASGTISAYFDNTARTGSYVQMGYTTYGYNSSNKPALSGSMDDDFTADAATTACSTSGVAYNTKWSCLQGSATGSSGNFNAGGTSSPSGDSSSWLWLQNQVTSAATVSNFGTTPSNTFMYQSMPSSYADGDITTVVNASSLYDTGASATTPSSPYNHVGLVLWTSNTDYIELQLYSDGAINDSGTNKVHVALNNSGSLSGAQNLNSATTGNNFSNIWLRLTNSGGSYQAKYSTDGTSFTSVGSAVTHGAFGRVGLNSFSAISNPATSYGGAFEWFSFGLAAPTYNQTGFRFFTNLDSNIPGSPLAAANTNYALTSAGQQFRLRQLLKVNGVVSAPNNTSTLVDSSIKSNSVKDYPVYKNGLDNFPRIVYADNSSNLKFIQCLDAFCASKNANTVATDAPISTGLALAMAIGSDGDARIVYTNSSNGMTFIQCTNADCTTKNSTVLDSSTTIITMDIAIASSDGFARIAYGAQPGTSTFLKYTQCTNASCTTNNTTTLESTLIPGSVSLALATDDTARIVYNKSSSFDQFVQCTNASCSTSSSTTISSAQAFSNSLKIASDGFGRIVEYDGTNNTSYLQCTNATCSTKNATTISSHQANWASLSLNSSDIGTVIFQDQTSAITTIITCSNAACSTNSSQTADNNISIVGGSYIDSANKFHAEWDDTTGLYLLGSNSGYRLQYALQGSACSSASYSDVSTSTPIAFYNNPTTADGVSTSTTANDPTDPGQTLTPETYAESNPASIVSQFGNSVDGEWDMSLYDNGAPSGASYCLRMVNADGTAFATYTNYPVITTFTSAPTPTTDQLMRGGKWFNGGIRQAYYWAN